MAHQVELEKPKYRNWVRGGLAYKYLKQGIEGFADDVVLQEQKRILQNIKHTPVQTCNQCKVGSFKPKHTCTGTGTCPRGLKNCSCLHRKKKLCPNKVCDAIMEEILDSHDSHCSKPPTPNWNNTDIHKWCTDPWEVAKCFIHSPGYFNKSNASDIDAAGLLHVFINNINLHSHLSCKILGNGTDIFSKTLRRRNAIFHSATMELEDNELNECIDDIIAILEDEKELKQRPDAGQAVEKLNQLKLGSFIITTNNEVEVCRDAMVSFTNKTVELKQMIQDSMNDIDQRKTQVSKVVDDKTRDALKKLETQNDGQLQAMKQMIQSLCVRLQHVEADNSAMKLDNSVMKQDISLIQQRLTLIQSSVEELDTTRSAHNKQLEYVKQKQADGLDEWTPPKHAPFPQHVSYGNPVADGVKNSTLVTLSRPSARGILNMKLSEYDQKIKLHGVSKVLLYDFIEKYMRKLNKIELRHAFKTKMNQAKLEHLEKTPLILQQLIWMFCTGVGTGESVADIYSNIVNIMFGWSEKKGEEDTTQSSVNTDREIKHIQLPKLLKRFSRCEENKRILFLLGELAFKILTKDMISTFGRSDLYHCGLSKDEIGKLVTSGILVEYNCFDPTIETTQLSFIHISYLEFFAAVYVSGHYSNSEQHLTHEQKPKTPKLENRMVLKELFMKYKSVEDILQLSNLLKMVCGLSPFLLEEISILISKNMMSDESMIKYRNKLSQFSDFDGYARRYEPLQIQILIRECFEECGTDDKPAVSLCDCVLGDFDFFLRESWSESFCQNIVSSSVLSIHVYIDGSFRWRELIKEKESRLNIERIKWISELHQLQFIRIDNIKSCEAIEQLESSLKETVLLKHLNLKSITCNNNTCKGHTIDLSGHSQLQSIHLNLCSVMLSSLVNTESLENVSISKSYGSKTPHVMCEHLSSSLSQAVSLKQLTLTNIVCDHDDCEGHTIDLSGHSQLQSIHLEDCSVMLSSLVNIKSVSISNDYGSKTPHVMCEHLSSLLSQAVSLKELKLKNIVCDCDDCEVHTIDLSKHDQFQSIEIENCSCRLGSVVNTKSLERVSITGNYTGRTHVMFEHLSSSLSQAVSLKQLSLNFMFCDRDDCEGHTIGLSKHDQLQSVDLSNFSISSINTKNLKTLTVSRSDVHQLLQFCYNSKLEHLSISGIIIHTYTSEMNSVVQSLQQLHTLILVGINIDENSLTVTAGMKSLKYITLWCVSMSLETWCTFVDSLLQLQHSVQVETQWLSIGQGQQNAALQYVRQDQAYFRIHRDDLFDIKFSSKKTNV